MSLFSLPKEIRLMIWSLIYFDERPRIVDITARPHNECHSEDQFCPRYSPSPAPVVVNLCKESRSEARHVAEREGHIVRLESPFAAPEEVDRSEFYFRFDKDILFLQLDGPRGGHYADSPEVGLLAHFRSASKGNVDELGHVAFTNERSHNRRANDGSLSNVLGQFQNISLLIFIITEQMSNNAALKETIGYGVSGLTLLYALDLQNFQRAHNLQRRSKYWSVDTDVAMRVGNSLVNRMSVGDWLDLPPAVEIEEGCQVGLWD
jgi:hypothetical protein